ncbi:tyrosine-type recombinase/integrase [Bradyrhizobium australafricanum]|uniref:tyrosine-type recombinase/integrase n=1 Tax=Bradyrhizobium australafricanum TaxID=2821406 RepID=UPI001CE24C89|nr:site-specific integrase [Bradyrhizobium australafricanum]MCA6097640.1 site-specific integrase [Bradyrhizobium australafricanum]
MARRTRSVPLENRTNRLKLAPRKKPYTALIAPGIFLAYRRNAGAGTWSVKCSGWLKRFSLADDHEDANGTSVMTYWQALEHAKKLARAGEGNTEQPVSVAEALDAYETDLETRDGSKYNATGVRRHLGALANKAVALLTDRELRDWRAGLIKHGLKRSSADRIARSLKAALTLAASNDKRITNAAAWKIGLKKLPDSETARNVILQDQTVAALVRGSYDVDHSFGVLIDTLAETGARESQVLRLLVDDLQDSNAVAARLMMPSSRKGKSRKIEQRPLPISSRLAKLLRQQAIGKVPHDRLIDRIPKLAGRFHPLAKKLGLGPEVTPYALRHSSIARQLLKGVPTRVVAAHHDTSVAMIEKNYSRYIIGDLSEHITREAMIDLGDARQLIDAISSQRLAS